jgi:deoxyinosine 3'endonuclease (endonuclease V)
LAKKLVSNNKIDWSINPKAPNALFLIGGVDISFVKDSDEDACASLIVLSYPDFKIVYEQYKMIKLTLPYIPTFLAFREVPFLVDMIKELKDTQPELMPQLILVDGNGKLHPRGFGLACHLGVLTDIPTIGVGKTLLYVDGLIFKNVRKEFLTKTKRGGDYMELVGKSGAVWGAAFRSTDDTKNPIFVSTGHRIDLKTAIEVVKQSCLYRIPEPVRQADLKSRDYIRKHVDQKKE